MTVFTPEQIQTQASLTPTQNNAVEAAKTATTISTPNAPVTPPSANNGLVDYNGSQVTPRYRNAQDKASTFSTNQSKIDSTQTDLQTKNDEYDAAAKQVHDTITSINNGSIPFTSSEQAQIDGLKQQFQGLIDKTKLDNITAEGSAITRGYQTGAAEYDPTFNIRTIGSIITKGQQNIADLNVKMAGAVADLSASIKSNDIKNVKDAWDVYNEAATKRIDALNKTITDTQKVIKDEQDRKDKLKESELKQEQDKRDYEEKVKEFIANNKLDEKKFGLEASKFQHQMDMDAASGISTLDDKGLSMLAKGYLTSGVLPSLGYGKAAVSMRTAIINKAVALSGGNENVNPAVNKAMYDANKATLSQQQKNYTVADTAYRIFDQNGQLALSLAQGLNKSNSPITNQLSNSVINQTTGTGQLDSFRAVITSLQSEYATLISVKGGGAGVTTEGDKAKAEKAIPMDISPARLKDVLTNLKTEGQNVLNERKQTIDQLQNNISGAVTAYDKQTQDKPILKVITSAQSEGYSPQEIVEKLQTLPEYSDIISKALAAGYDYGSIITSLSQ